MIISILRDKKNSGTCLSKEAVSVLIQNHHTVLIEGDGGDKVLMPYLNVGAYIIDTQEELLDRGDIIVKMTEPESSEVEYLNGEEKIFFTAIDFTHKKLIEKVLAHKMSVINYSLLKGIKKGTVKAMERVAFSNYTLPFLLELANKKLQALVDDEVLRAALVVMNGKVYNAVLAQKYGWQCYEF